MHSGFESAAPKDTSCFRGLPKKLSKLYTSPSQGRIILRCSLCWQVFMFAPRTKTQDPRAIAMLTRKHIEVKKLATYHRDRPNPSLLLYPELYFMECTAALRRHCAPGLLLFQGTPTTYSELCTHALRKDFDETPP